MIYLQLIYGPGIKQDYYESYGGFKDWMTPPFE
jgi:hypothetical protein